MLGGPGFGAPPSFVCAASDDECCPCVSVTDPYVAALKAKHIPVTYVRRKFGGHGFGHRRRDSNPGRSARLRLTRARVPAAAE